MCSPQPELFYRLINIVADRGFSMQPHGSSLLLKHINSCRGTGALRQHAPRLSHVHPKAILLIPARFKADVVGPPPNSAYPSITRWHRYEDPSEDLSRLAEDRRGRNPLNYIDRERRRVRGNQVVKRRMYHAGFGLAICIVVQIVLVFTMGDEQARTSGRGMNKEKLDARPPREGEKGFAGADGVVVAGEKPGPDGIKVDEEGNELVETGSSSIPYFPRTIRLPATQGPNITLTGKESATSPSPSTLPAPAPATSTEGYTLLGHGIRTVSFLSIKVYVLGIYIRNSDLPVLHAALVRAVSPSASASSLLPAEKADLRKRLLDPDGSTEIWDKVLREAGVRMAVRVVPTRNTDFAHLRDGWVTGMTARTRDATRVSQAAAKEKGLASGAGEYDDETFGAAINDFKALFGGRGSTPQGSEVMLVRDERGALAVSYRTAPQNAEKPEPQPTNHLGRIEDRRVGRLVWLGYLAGAKVSSEAARQSVVDGVMELVERPVGTVGVGAP